MWYHAVTDYGEKTRYWWNRTREDLVNDLLLPLIDKEIRFANRRGKRVLFNFGSISYMAILGTEVKLARSGPGEPPAELLDSDFIKENSVTEEFVEELKVKSASPESRSVLQQAVGEPLKQIFVVMKFGDRQLDSAYQGVIKPTGEGFGFRVLRVDEIHDAGLIARQVLESISKSELVLAELSGARPNCYYEAGFAHALGKQMIFCIREGEDIHFDLAGYRFIRWGTEAELRRMLSEHLESYTSKGAE